MLKVGDFDGDGQVVSIPEQVDLPFIFIEHCKTSTVTVCELSHGRGEDEVIADHAKLLFECKGVLNKPQRY